MSVRSQNYVAGPAELFVGTGASGALEFLGWSQAGMRMTFDFEFENVMSDISGTRIPIDMQKMGRQMFMAGDLSLFNWPVLSRFISATGEPGEIAAGEIGTLINLENSGGVQVVMNTPYKTLKPTVFDSAGSEMEGPFVFSKGFLISPFDIDPISTRVQMVRFVIQALPVWDHVAGTATLYTTTLPALPAKY